MEANNPDVRELTMAERVQSIVNYCMYDAAEVGDSLEPPIGAVCVEGILANYAFEPNRLIERTDEIREILDLMPAAFHDETASFLGLCQDRDGNCWAEQDVADLLVTLGLAVRMVRFVLPREMWGSFAGEMPYLSFHTGTGRKYQKFTPEKDAEENGRSES